MVLDDEMIYLIHAGHMMGSRGGEFIAGRARSWKHRSAGTRRISGAVWMPTAEPVRLSMRPPIKSRNPDDPSTVERYRAPSSQRLGIRSGSVSAMVYWWSLFAVRDCTLVRLLC
jgi:hypothetical protein